MNNIDFDLVFQQEEFIEEFLEGNDERREFFGIENQARSYLSAQPWCPPIQDIYVAAYCQPIVAVFLYKVDIRHPTARNVDGVREWVWVVVGDFPPLYFMNDQITDALDALMGYVSVIGGWIKAVDQGRSIEEFSFIDAPADSEHADMLRIRMDLLKQHFLQSAVPPLFPGLLEDEE